MVVTLRAASPRALISRRAATIAEVELRIVSPGTFPKPSETNDFQPKDFLETEFVERRRAASRDFAMMICDAAGELLTRRVTRSSKLTAS
ncbi:hypothetical protein [Bradyrhizobium sp. USDA 4454]